LHNKFAAKLKLILLLKWGKTSFIRRCAPHRQ